MNPTSYSGLAMNDQPAANTVQRIHDALRQRIITLDLPPGTVLSRTELTEEYGVSQTPLREALQKLAHDGLVTIRPQSKTIVSRIDTEQLREAHFLRVALETEVSRRLAEDLPEGTIARLRSIIRMQQAVGDDPSQYRIFQELDELFHQTLFIAAGQPDLHRLVRERAGHMERVRQLHLPHPGKISDILERHTAIVDRIEAQDAPGAMDAARSHLSRTVLQVEALREKHPDYFT
ncbi:GntR family transcriptional regulator [Falsirhodobacter sp. 20TX0035]|uniref:GntR family transcriptional regulator n=1 Tax=Falsirhodobacter sp. 20TX0035 TaxID=3022019 RepID=UPI00233126D7|nr:GntR family transcriptional regulator [Falsirhodobacter sp. 20TX0035]MDB6454299.1 GntR family transcriptional regulator [Falsirhodobacter sp. 20TX0035]